jgi:hypothetical protein
MNLVNVHNVKLVKPELTKINALFVIIKNMEELKDAQCARVIIIESQNAYYAKKAFFF